MKSERNNPENKTKFQKFKNNQSAALKHINEISKRTGNLRIFSGLLPVRL